MEQKYRPGENWLGFILGNTVWYDLSNSMTYETQLTNFLGAIANIGTEAKRTDQPGNLWRLFFKILFKFIKESWQHIEKIN